MKLYFAAAVFLSLSSGAAVAQNTPWDFRGYVYLWGSSLGGTSASGQDFEMSFNDVLDKLDFALMGAVEANRGPISLLLDTQYLNLSEGLGAAVGPGIPATADARLKGLVVTGTAGYEISATGQSRLVGFGGFRTVNLDTTVNIAVGGGSSRVSDTLRNWDAIAGLRGSTQLNDRWSLSYYGDIGAGESDLTWQLALMADYKINNWSLSFGYRHMEWDVSNSSTLTNLKLSGPVFGAKFRF